MHKEYSKSASLPHYDLLFFNRGGMQTNAAHWNGRLTAISKYLSSLQVLCHGLSGICNVHDWSPPKHVIFSKPKQSLKQVLSPINCGEVMAPLPLFYSPCFAFSILQMLDENKFLRCLVFFCDWKWSRIHILGFSSQRIFHARQVIYNTIWPLSK